MTTPLYGTGKPSGKKPQVVYATHNQPETIRGKELDKFEKEGVARQMEKVLVRNIHNPYSEDETCDVWSCKEDGKYWFVMNAGRFSEHIYNEQRPINANIQIYKLPSK